jgi:hypothetical protein
LGRINQFTRFTSKKTYSGGYNERETKKTLAKRSAWPDKEIEQNKAFARRDKQKWGRKEGLLATPNLGTHQCEEKIRSWRQRLGLKGGEFDP